MRTKAGHGPNVVTNGTFDSGTGWTTGDGWSIAAGVASSDGTQTDVSLLTNSATVVSGSRYRCKFTVSGYSTGTVRVRLGGANGATRYANGTYT